MNFETSSDCNNEKVNHDKTLQKYAKSCVSTKKNPKGTVKQTECNSDKVNHNITLQKYSKSYNSMNKFQNEL
jgi:hypothetical protein